MTDYDDYDNNLAFDPEAGMVKIDQLVPLLKPGWVAMDKSGLWVWYEKKPVTISWEDIWIDIGKGKTSDLDAFKLAPADDWRNSLIKVGG